MLSSVKLIVSDMDGTLLNSNHEVSDLFFEQFKILKEKNIKFVAASGRQYHSILQKLAPLKKDITIVAENGAYVVEDEKELFVNAFQQKEVKELLLLAQQIPNTNIVLCGKKRAYFLNTSEAFTRTVSEYYSEYEILPNFEVLPNDLFLKIALCHHKGAEEYIYPHVKHLEKEWQVKISGELWVDIALNDNHKGNAIARIQEEYSISVAETMAFGDYFNDVEMLSRATHSYAMQNAHKAVKKIANYETRSNDELGVETVIAQLIKEL